MDRDGSTTSLQIHGTFYILQGTIKGSIMQQTGLQSVHVWLALCSGCGGLMIDDTEWFASCRIASICDLTFPLLSVAGPDTIL
jgi:hypothetical protein